MQIQTEREKGKNMGCKVGVFAECDQARNNSSRINWVLVVWILFLILLYIEILTFYILSLGTLHKSRSFGIIYSSYVGGLNLGRKLTIKNEVFFKNIRQSLLEWS